MHHALEALDARGIRPLREHRTPERILSWIDAEFGGVWSSEAATGGIWIAEDATGPIGFAAYDAHGLPYHWLRTWQQRPSTGMFGPIGVTPRARGHGLGATFVQAALFSLRERGYRQALIPVVADPSGIGFYERAAGARVVENVDPGRRGRRWRATVLASGNGTNFQGVIDASATGDVPLEVVALIASDGGARVLERARVANVAAHVVAWDRRAESRAAYDERILAAVATTEPDVVLLLGWMHVLPAPFVARFPQTLNLHPAFLPFDPAADTVTMPDGSSLAAFRGRRAFEDALAAGGRWGGATVHRVSVAVDRGEVLARAPLAIARDESRGDLDLRLHALERQVVRTAVRRWTWEQR